MKTNEQGEITKMNDPETECPICGGLGDVPDDGTNYGECDYCNGTGLVEVDYE